MRAKAILIVGGCLLGAVLVVLPRLRPIHPGMRPSCVANLRQLQGAKEMWTLEFHKTINDVPTWDDLRPYLHGQTLPCPQHGTYALGRIGELPSCSIPEHTAQYREYP